MQSNTENRRRFRGIRFLALLLMLIPLSLTQMQAQSDAGRVTGSVQDTTGAVVGGATVTLTNIDSGAVSTATSDGAGNFIFSVVPQGSYKIQVKMTGFESQVQDFKLDVSQTQTVNFKLKAGAVTTEVTVTDAAPLVETSSSSTGEVIEGRQLAELPLNGRNFIQLALLAPGVTRGAYGNQASGVQGNTETLRNNETGSASLTANGIRPQANNFILDGVDNNESLVNTINFFPPVEAMQEFKVTTTVAPAEFGRAGGAVVQASIKSGTNGGDSWLSSLHGSAFEFYRDQAFNANPNYFSPTSPNKTFHRNQYGFTLGGRIIRDKLFLFGDYQGQSQKAPQGVYISTTPTSKMRTGDFSELLGSGLTVIPNNTVAQKTTANPNGVICPNGMTLTNGTVVTSTSALNASVGNGAIFDPTTCKQWNYGGHANMIDPTRLNKAAVNYLNAFPGVNHASNNVLNNYANTQTEDRHYQDFDVRLDFNPTQKDTTFVRYSYGKDDQTKSTRYVGLPSGFGSGSNANHPRGVTAGYNHVFTPTIVNEFRFGYSRPFYGYINPFEGVPFSANLGIQNANRNALLGGGALIGGYDGEIGYTGDGGPYEVPQASYQYLDTVNWNHGKHAFKFGMNLMQRQVNFFQADYRSKGFFFIGGQGNDYTGYEVSELLAAFVDNYSIANPLGYYHTRSWESGYFAQDDWRLNQRLTLNLGLRYDLYTWPYETHNYQSNFDIPSGSLLVAGKNGNSRSLIDTNFHNFAPRIGFAYDLTGKGRTIVRGGYGIFYFLDRGGVGNQLSNNPDFNGASSYGSNNGYRATFTGQGPLYDNNALDATQALPSASFTVNESAPTNVSVISYPKKNHTPMIQQWNLQVEQQIGANTVLDVAYVGTRQTHLFNVIGYSNPQLATGTKFFASQGLSVTQDTDNGSGSYNGMQIRVDRRLVHGFQYTVAYTWSHALDNSTGPFSPTSTGNIFMTANGPLLSANYGNAGDDQRQAATFSGIYELPFGQGKAYAHDVSKAVDYIIGGWQINPLAILGSGTPFDLSVNSQGGVGNRPDLVSSPHIGYGLHDNNGIHWINASAFKDPPVNAAGIYYRPGGVGHNRYYGPGYDVVNMSIFKNIPITEHFTARLQFEGYNLFNTPQFANPGNNNVDSGASNFGIINSTRYTSARQLQFAVHIQF